VYSYNAGADIVSKGMTTSSNFFDHLLGIFLRLNTNIFTKFQWKPISWGA